MRKRIIAFLLMMLLCLGTAVAESIDYSDPAMWAYFGGNTETAVDVFFIAPTNVGGSPDHLNVDLTNEDEAYAVKWGIAMQTGIYGKHGETARFYAPYYHQVTMACYALPEEEREPYLAIAEEDVMAAFKWYMEHENNGRPLILAGFSQGSDMGLRILKAYADDEEFGKNLVAAYLIGWRVTDEDLKNYPSLKMAQGESDTGVIITFECEAENVTGTIIVPEGVFTHSINPLNWKTDGTVATKEENLGYVYPDKEGGVKKEIPNLCGAYIDAERGTLKVTDVTPEEYPARLAVFPEGSYHIYDYEFFYRNLQKNVETRMQAWLDAN